MVSLPVYPFKIPLTNTNTSLDFLMKASLISPIVAVSGTSRTSYNVCFLDVL